MRLKWTIDWIYFVFISPPIKQVRFENMVMSNSYIVYWFGMSQTYCYLLKQKERKNNNNYCYLRLKHHTNLIFSLLSLVFRHLFVFKHPNIY